MKEKPMPNNCKSPEMCLLSETCVPCAICPNAQEKAEDRLDLTACSAVGATHHHACACREKAMLEILVLVEPIMEAWAKSHELHEWHCRVEDLIGTAYPSFMDLPNASDVPCADARPLNRD